MKTRQILKILLVVAGAAYLIRRAWGSISQITHDWTSLIGMILLLGLIGLGIGRVLRA